MAKTVAVIGASANRRKYGNKALRAFQQQGYTVFPVNTHETEVEGLRAYRSVLDIPVPLDMATVLASLGRTSRLVTVEENPYQGGWGATLVSVVADEGFSLLDAPVRRVAAECVPLPFADVLEEQVIPTVDKVVAAVRSLAAY